MMTVTENDLECIDYSMDDNTIDSDLFSLQYHLQCEQAVSLRKTSLLHMCGTESDVNIKIGVSTSNFACSVFDVETSMKKLVGLTGHRKAITNVRFLPESDNIMLSSSLDGCIKIWDLRAGKCVNVLMDPSGANGKPISAFDVSCNGQFVCGGTELIGSEAFLLFWDMRSVKILGGYWDSHSDDITQVLYGESNSNLLVTGSMDGLINVFDTIQSCEDDALTSSLNTGSSVEKLGWVLHDRNKNCISCITHMGDLQLWKTDGSEPVTQFTRDAMGSSIMVPTEWTYIVNVHHTIQPGRSLILAGSTSGKGECLRSMELNIHKLTPSTNFVDNKQIVRASWYSAKTGILITGGESGIVSVWQPGEPVQIVNSNKKIISKGNKHKVKPY